MPHTQTTDTELEQLSFDELFALCKSLIEQKQYNENEIEIKRIITFLAKTLGLGVIFTEVKPKF